MTLLCPDQPSNAASPPTLESLLEGTTAGLHLAILRAWSGHFGCWPTQLLQEMQRTSGCTQDQLLCVAIAAGTPSAAMQ